MCGRFADGRRRWRIGWSTKIACKCVTAAAASLAARIPSEGPTGGDRRRCGGGRDAMSFPPRLPMRRCPARGGLLGSLASAGGRLAFGLFLQAQRSDLVRIGAELGDDLILDAENQVVMFPLRGNRRVACGVERILGAQFDLRGGAHGIVSGRDRCQAVGRVGRAVAGDRLERQKGVFIGLLCFRRQADFFVLCHVAPPGI